jgi:hypothetical protein
MAMSAFLGILAQVVWFRCRRAGFRVRCAVKLAAGTRNRTRVSGWHWGMAWSNFRDDPDHEGMGRFS